MANMKIVAYSDRAFKKPVIPKTKGEYELMLNPEKLQWNRSVQYNQEAPINSSKAASKYHKTPNDKLSFEIVIDCTGVVDSERVDLPTEIAQLSKVMFTYNGTIHRPNFIVVRWGRGLVFPCVLTSFNLSYTFFNPDGTPLRAKVSLEFSSYTDPATIARLENKQSPDMSHLIRVVDGDSLPHISMQIYNSPDYYVQIAKFNGLDKFRNLQAGTLLTIPPLIAESTTNG